MNDDPPYIPPGAEDESEDVIGKLDDLIGRHKPRLQADEVPVLTEAQRAADEDIPTLTDIVSRPASAEREPAPGPGLESALVQRLAMRLEVERSRLVAEGASADRTAVLDELIARLRESLPDIVRVALEREERR